MNIQLIAGVAFGAVFLVGIILAFAWREVVPSNKVHIVQSRSTTTSYGTNQSSGNVYYAIPSFIPVFGISRISLPVNNFALTLHEYKAYDKDRVPFELDVTAFFRIADTNVAASRVEDFEGLHKQLESVVQGAVRKILASYDIHQIMVDRSTFGKQFTEEVATELANWGVEPVKNMELMDIRDSGESRVLANIMAKKSSHIEMESRVEVATNKQKASVAETEAKRISDTATIDANQQIEVSKLQAQQAVGERGAATERAIGVARADQEKTVGVSREQAAQAVKEQAAATKKREMEIVSVEVQRKAEIEKSAAVVKAEQEKQVTVTVAEGKLEQAKREAEGTRATGTAQADAAKAMQLAPVEAQITLAKEIGNNQGYQTYLVTLRKIEADQAIGIAQAEALTEADIKVIANTGDAPSGINSIGDIFTSKGGLAVGAALEGLKNTPEGAKVLSKLTGNGSGTAQT